MPDKAQIADWFRHLQDQICQALETEDGKVKFQEDLWQRDGGGGGRTRVIQNGAVFEKGGVNFSAVHGQLPETIQKALKVDEADFFATGISIVIHPQSPRVPIIHMNTRYFELSESTWWFGGGIDLTPHYIVPEDARFFHQSLKAVCDRFDANYYPKFKTWADDYFFIRHRNETRGIGGIFFDRMVANESHDKTALFEYVKAVGAAFAPTYTELVQRNKHLTFGDQESNFQLFRRGRYVEFNLVYDKGTKFGLDTSGRIESILMSLPNRAGWPYDYQPEAGSAEEATLNLLRKEVDWINM
ncbi:MAG: oxygen-dependent coproporphyrinogen oxidase [Salibacteraceae bacterium]